VKRRPFIEVFYGRKSRMWHSRLVGGQGEVVWSGEANDAVSGSKSKANCLRTARKYANLFRVDVRVVE
jgi:hypothetical protein